MNFYPFLPPLFAIYLILVSSFTDKYARSLIADSVQRNIARDWESRIGFITSMISSLVGLYSVFETSQSFRWLTAMSLLLISIFVPMLFWIISHKAGQLSSVRTRRGHLLHTTVCAIVLIMVNIALVVAIAINALETPKDERTRVHASRRLTLACGRQPSCLRHRRQDGGFGTRNQPHTLHQDVSHRSWARLPAG